MQKQKLCLCGAIITYEANIFNGQEIFEPLQCDDCTDRINAEYQSAEQKRKYDEHIAKWEAICPPLYRDTDTKRLIPALRILAEGWYSGQDGKGLGLAGNTGIAKTRTAFLILKRFHFSGQRVAAMSAIKFSKLCADQFADDYRIKNDAREKLAALLTASLILIDDVGKEKMTERVTTEMFNLVEERTANFRPIIWTTNLDAGQLKHAFNDQTKSDPIVRRLREFSDIPKL